jgi:hypothetical protein
MLLLVSLTHLPPGISRFLFFVSYFIPIQLSTIQFHKAGELGKEQ